MQSISEAILSYLENAGIDTRQIDYKEIIDRSVGSLQRPAVNISISSGAWQKITLDTKKVNLNVSLLILVQNIKGEKERRFEIYALIEAIADALFIVSLDLELQDLLEPVSFTDVTDTRFADAGYQLMQMQFTCSYNYRQVQEDEGILRTLVNSYVRDGELIGQTDTVAVGKYWGGSAFESSGLPPLDGGRAGTTYWQDPVWGGYSASTYDN